MVRNAILDFEITRMKQSIILLIFILQLSLAIAQEKKSEKPKLVVGVMVDQMRQEYLYRFYNKYGEGGFKRLIREGFECRNAHYNYTPTITGAGHASVYTGTTPSIHGIIDNEWYDKNLKTRVNCVEDARYKPVGSDSGKGKISPWRMLSTTITDELKLSTQNRAKVIAASIKDRGAVLPAGHNPDGAYWYDDKTGRFITSTYYMDNLPEWVTKFNQRALPEKYLSQDWNTYYPIDQYTESGPDDSPYEVRMSPKEKPVFPYKLKDLHAKNRDFGLLASTPFANDYLTEMAKAALDGEKLGIGEFTDFLSISYSSPDIIGHAMGPNSVEVEDTYIRLDKNIEDLLQTLDQKVGKDNYILFLTADHGVADVAQYLKDNKIPAGYYNTANIRVTINELLKHYFPDKEIIQEIDDQQIFFNHDLFRNNPRVSGIDLIIATELVSNFLLTTEGVANVYSESILRQANYDEGGIKGMVVRGYHPKRSGDITIVLEPGWYAGGRVQGTTHGSPYTYDTNVPILFYGHGIKKGFTVAYHPITDIAPTLSVLLKIKFPNGCTGQPIGELMD